MVLGSGNLKEVGVKAVVAGIAQFASDMTRMNRAIDSFGSKANIASRAISPLTNAIRSLGDFLRGVAEVAAGILVAGVIRKITDSIIDMGREALAAGERFQQLQIRLEGLLARDIQADQDIPFVDALRQATPLAEELFGWVQRLALQSPFDIEEVANVLTLGKSYGFATDMAQTLTSAVTDFSSGMGLGNLEMVRVIENLGQMVQQGKITGTELRDLGRGAFVPVNELLNRMQERLGLTDDEFKDFKATGEGVNEFIKEFIDFVGTDFPGAGQRASRTLAAVRGNFMDLLQGMLGFNVVRPVLDVIAGRAAEFLDAFTTGERGEKVISISKQIGEALSGIVEVLFGALPSVDLFADAIINGMDRVKGVLFAVQEILRAVFAGEVTPGQGFAAFLATLGVPQSVIDSFWSLVDLIERVKTKIGEIKDRVIEAFGVFQQEGLLAGLASLGVPAPILEFVEKIKQAFEDLRTFWAQNGEEILDIFGQIFEAVSAIVGEAGETGFAVLGTQLRRFAASLAENGPDIVEALGALANMITDDVVPAVSALGDWVVQNQDRIVDFLAGFWLGLKLLGAVVGVAAAALIGLLSPLIAFGGALVAAAAAFPIFLGLMWAFRDQITGFAVNFVQTGLQIGSAIIVGIINGFNNLAGHFIDTVFQIGVRLSQALNDWYNIGRSTGLSIIGGIISGFSARAGEFLSLIITLAINAWNTVKWILGIGSPSKLFMGIGENIVEGLIAGVANMTPVLQSAMAGMVGMAISPVVNTALAPSAASINNSTTNNFNLNVTSASQKEPLIADFRMMEALTGGS